jgi:hypothetical protein
MVRRNWSRSEEQTLLDNYADKTIKELMELLPNRPEDAINSKIKRLKKTGKLKTVKTPQTVTRAYKQRT